MNSTNHKIYSIEIGFWEFKLHLKKNNNEEYISSIKIINGEDDMNIHISSSKEDFKKIITERNYFFTSMRNESNPLTHFGVSIRFFPRFKVGHFLHLRKKETKKLMDFIIYHLKPEYMKRDDIIDSLFSEE